MSASKKRSARRCAASRCRPSSSSMVARVPSPHHGREPARLPRPGQRAPTAGRRHFANDLALLQVHHRDAAGGCRVLHQKKASVGRGRERGARSGGPAHASGDLDLVAELQVVGAIDLDHISARAALQPRADEWSRRRVFTLRSRDRQVCSPRNRCQACRGSACLRPSMTCVRPSTRWFIAGSDRYTRSVASFGQLRDRQLLIRQLGSARRKRRRTRPGPRARALVAGPQLPLVCFMKPSVNRARTLR